MPDDIWTKAETCCDFPAPHTAKHDALSEVSSLRQKWRVISASTVPLTKEGQSTTVDIKADQSTKHEKIVQMMDVAAACGIEKLGIQLRR